MTDRSSNLDLKVGPAMLSDTLEWLEANLFIRRGEYESGVWKLHRERISAAIRQLESPPETPGKRACECKGVCAMAVLVPFYCTGAVPTSEGQL